MRVLIVSDIHGNEAALTAVAAEPHDMVICLGDIVGYGPDPKACVDWVRANADWVVQGNHDRANADFTAPRCHPDFAWLADAVAPLTRAQLDDADRSYLHRLPKWIIRDLDGIQVACFHAAPSDPLYGYMPSDPKRWAREIEQVEADLILVGHTHLPLDLSIGDKRVINPGSVGQPKHGDPCAAYAILVDGKPELKRRTYPVEETAHRLRASAVSPDAVDVLTGMLLSGQPPKTPAITA